MNIMHFAVLKWINYPEGKNNTNNILSSYTAIVH